jgi:hypothetical protein
MIALRIQELSSLLERLLSAPAVPVNELLRQRLEAADLPGVYLISQTEAADSPVYAGRTKTKSVLGRLRDHCVQKTGSDLAGMLSRHPTYPQDPRSYYLRWVAVPDDIARAQLELFAISVLRPPFNRYI